MRKIVFSALALASLSLPVCAADSAPVARAYDWTGFYLGAQIGGEFGSANYHVPQDGYSRTITNSGVFGGGFVGYNFRSVPLFSVCRASSTAPASPAAISTRRMAIPSRRRRTGSLRLTAVSAMASINSWFTPSAASRFPNIKHDFTIGSASIIGLSSTRTGFDVGGGVEYALTPNWTARLEYRFYNFGETSYAAEQGPFGGTLFAHNFKQTDNSVRIGVAYKF